MEYIFWDIINLMELVDEKLDVFNDLYFVGLDNYVLIKMVKLRWKLNLVIIFEIKEFIIKRN